MDDELVLAVAEVIPPFNTDMLKNHVEREVGGAANFIDAVYRDRVRSFDGAITYHGYRVLNPIERARYELDPKNRIGASIATSELMLVEYKFRWNNEEFTPHYYLPYIRSANTIVIDDKRYGVQKTITERIFARTSDTITVRVIRAPLRFERKIQFVAEPVTDGPKLREYLYLTKLYLKHRDTTRTTILHYLIAKFGYVGALRMLGLRPDDLVLTDEIVNDTDEFIYYAARKTKINTAAGCYLKVRRSEFENPDVRRAAINILFTLTRFARHDAKLLYDPSSAAWRLMLGWLLKGERGFKNDAGCLGQMDDHIASLDNFLDPISRHRCMSFGVNVVDVYELLRYVYVNMDRIMVQSVQQNLYDKRISILDNLAVQLWVRNINLQFYAHEKNAHRFVKNDILQMLRSQARRVTQLYKSAVISAPAVYGDNWLPAIGIKKTRFNGNSVGKRLPNPSAPENKFHPSAAVVETLVAFAGKTPGQAGSINPHAQITDTGGIVRPDYAADIERITPYL